MESNTGQIINLGSLYHRFAELRDKRKAKGKRYALATILLGMFLAKLCGEDKPMGIAEWAKHRQAALIKLLCLNWPRMPHHNTYRRILAYQVYAEEVERLVREYNRQGEHGKVYALDGKAVRGMRKKDEEGN